MAAYAVLLVGWLTSTSAQAHPDLERGAVAIMNADYELALRAFGEALDSGELSRDELVQLLGERALVLHALERHDEVEADLRYLAALDPRYALSGLASPGLQRRWQQIAASARPYRLQSDAEAVAGGLRIRVTTFGDVPEPRPAIRIAIRAPGGKWRAVYAVQTEFPLASQGHAECYVQAEGLGGTILAQLGSAQRPLRLEAAQLAAASITYRAGSGFWDDRRRAWVREHRGWLIGAAALAAVVVASAVGVGVALQRKHAPTEVSPTVAF